MSEVAENRNAPPREARRRGDLTLLEDIARATAQSADLRDTGQRIVEDIARHLSMEVCSIYVYSPEDDRLTLWATTGLDPAAVGKVHMAAHEGLTGLVIQRREPVMAIDALAHPRYKYFPETGEERYHSFLGVPVVDRGTPLGVLIVQTSRRRRFSRNEVRLLRMAAVPVAGILAQARLQASLADKEEERLSYQRGMADAIDRLRRLETQAAAARAAGPNRLLGMGASPGYGIGRAHLITPAVSFIGLPRERRNPLRRELARLHTAVRRAAEEIDRTKQRIVASVPEIDAAVFDAQRLMLEDRAFVGRIEVLVRDGLSAEAALERAVDDTVREFGRLDDPYLRDRASDIRDIGQRLLRHLLGVTEAQRQFATAVVLVGRDVGLSDLALMEREDLKGVVLASGGVTSHASILAKSLEIPTVVGVERAEEAIREGDHLIVDGNTGTVFVNPGPELVREYERLAREYRAFNRGLETLRDLPAETLDGHRVTLCANIGLLGDLKLARAHGAEGIGLYRTEVPFLSHRNFLSEDEQVRLYEQAVAGMEGRPVTIRTLDLGADKYPHYLETPREDNPFLGWRSIRISLEMPEVFKEQLRAILRVSARGRVRLMFPMISSLEEIRQAKALLAEARREVEQAGHPHDPRLAVGMMIEVPAAAYLVSRFLEEVDFVSIGTNDLIQYLLAVDRNNRKVGRLYEPLHPAVIRCVADVIAAARRAGKPVSLCGEMASDPACTLLLVGLGIDDLSMGPFFIPAVKRLIRAVTVDAARRLAHEVLTLGAAGEVRNRIYALMRDLGVIDIMERYH